MKDILERIVFTVRPSGAAWAVEQDGVVFGHASDKEAASAWVHRRARQVMDGGGAVRIHMHGEVF